MSMKKSVQRAVEKYVYDMMPEEVKEARSRALYNLNYGPADPEEDIDTTWATNSKIVNDWWDENMGHDLVIDDADNVSTVYEWEKFMEQIGKERYDEARQEYLDEHSDEAEDEDVDVEGDADKFAEREAQYYVDSSSENSWRMSDHEVKNLILSSDWP